MQILFTILAVLAGIAAGALVNWLADTLPERKPFSRPAYPDGTLRSRPAWSAIGARLSGNWQSPGEGGAHLKWRSLVVEIALAIIFGYLAAGFTNYVRSIFWMADTVILMLITVIDLEHRLVLLSVVIPGWILALIGGAVAGQVPFPDYLIGGAAGFILFFILYLGGIAFSAIAGAARGEALTEVAFGYGDVLLATLAGFLLGWQALIFAVIITILAGATGAVIFLSVKLGRRGRYEMFTALPYGQYIVLGTVIMLYWFKPIIALLQKH